MSEENGAPISFYEAVGGQETFTRLVRRVYEEVAAGPVLRPGVPTGGPRPGGGAPAFVPHPVRGRAADLQRAARASPAADAARPVPHRRDRAGPVAQAHGDGARRSGRG